MQVFDQLRLQCFGIGEVDDADGNGCSLGHLRGAITPRSGDDLEALLGEGPNKQGRENSLGADALGKLLEGGILEDAARVGGGLGEDVRGEGCGIRWRSAVFMAALLERLGVRGRLSGRHEAARPMKSGLAGLRQFRRSSLLVVASAAGVSSAERMTAEVFWMTSRLSARSAALPWYRWM